MSRTFRVRSYSGLYHVILRGIDRRAIFMDEMDRAIFLKSLAKAKEKSGFKLYAYCLMDNHVHILLREEQESLEKIFKRAGVSYVAYYNRKYDLYGHLYQDRFHSEPIDSKSYFMDVLRYICQNPVKAGLCDSFLKYRWLECSGVINKSGIIDDISEYTSLSRSELIEFINKDSGNTHPDDIPSRRINDSDAIKILLRVTDCTNPYELAVQKKANRNDSLRKCLRSGISIRQLSRITGISKNIIERAKRDVIL